MKLSKILAGLAIITFTGASFAQNWVAITETENSKFYIMSGSVDMGKTDGGQHIFFARGLSIRSDTQKTENQIWYVKVPECMKRSGKFVVADMTGQFLFDTEFKFGNNTVASTLAEIICGAGMEKLIPPNSKQQRL